ncbi:MAG: cation:proton antiporter [Bacteroidia bacterium]|nr:cation:proton antiporter [Bacteroidia bacterium]
MAHLPDLIRDLALILMTGAATTILFRKIKQPLVLGYIIAGFLVGPHVHFLPTVADIKNVDVLAEIGVIFLLFGLGLEFSFKKLMRVGAPASITALVEIAFITVAGFFMGKLLGWSVMDSLFLGGMLASSSTTIIIRAFDELGVKSMHYARIVFGVLIVEDIVVILLMVLLSSIAATQQIQGAEIVLTSLKLVFFLSLWFLGGIFLLPTLLKRIRPFLDEEVLLILSIGLCLGMVVLATQVGFSAELGAFMMGSIIAETTSAEKVEHVIKPIKDMFGAVFFVSVGMLIDPQVILEYGWPVVFVTLLTLFGKLISTTIGALLSGQPLRQSIQVGMSMAQIGEFAFIVATLGLSLGVISDFLFPVAVGASAITTFTTPYLIKLSVPFSEFLEQRLPASWIRRIHMYSRSAQSMGNESDAQQVVKSYLLIMVVNSIIILALMFLSLNFLIPFLQELTNNMFFADFGGIIVSLAIASPFLWALMAKQPSIVAGKISWQFTGYRQGPIFVFKVIRVAVGISLITFWVFKIFWLHPTTFIAVPVIIVLLFLFGKRIQIFYQRLEDRFIRNLNARERAEYNTTAASVLRKNASMESELSPWDAHIIRLEVPANAAYTGRKLSELAWREKYGINVAYIKRGDHLLHQPVKDSFMLPFDEIGVIATREQMNVFQPMFEQAAPIEPDAINVDNIVLQKFSVNGSGTLNGLTLRESGIREETGGLVVGIERDNQRILNPESTEILNTNDIVWIVGERDKIKKFIHDKNQTT